MPSNTVSLPAAAQPEATKSIIDPWYAVVQFLTPSGDEYTGEYSTLQHAVVERITTKVGPEPGEAIIQLPIDLREIRAGKRVFDHITYIPGDSPAELTPLLSTEQNLVLGSRVRIFLLLNQDPFEVARRKNFAKNRRRDFVGLVTDIHYFSLGKTTTGTRIICKDDRELLRKTPCMGYLFFNPNRINPPTLAPSPTGGPGEIVYIRDHDIIFNEGQKPNRFENPRDDVSLNDPVFINIDHNRFVDSDVDDDAGGTVDYRMYLHDGALTTALLARIEVPFADKWRPAHVWNYIANLTQADAMQGDNRIYNIPDSLDEEFLGPLRDDLIEIQRLFILGKPGSGNPDIDMFEDWVNPRALIGATSQTGFATSISAIGEFDVTGQPVNEVLFRICRMVGNYTLAIYFTDDDKTVLLPIRTIQGLGEDGSSTVGFQGRRGGTGGGKALSLAFPSSADLNKPSAPTLDIKVGTSSLYNDFIMKAGTRFVTSTFTTVAGQGWTDELGQDHQPYVQGVGAVPAGQWIPALDTPTLIPGWNKADQDNFIKQFLVDGTTELFPDAFSTWIIPLDGPNSIDWTKFLLETIAGDKPGFRRFIQKDRALQKELVISIFNTTLGLYRARRIKEPIVAMRAFKGIRTDVDGSTPYGDNSTEDNFLEGYDDWFVLSAGFDLLSDGRIGIKFHPEARLNRNFRFENQPPFDTSGASRGKTPAVWNGLQDTTDPVVSNARSYEIMVTITFALDEDLAEVIRVPNVGIRKVKKFGPRMMMYRNAGNEYGMEHAIHALVPRYNPSATGDKYLAIPPVDGTGKKDAEERIYRDDRDEVLARTRMMANRHTVPDFEGTFHLDTLDPSYHAGDYIEKIITPDFFVDINANSIISSVTHDLQNQKTSIEIATIR